ncbi:MAG: CBS domain-containing protein [Pyrobaculum sp.]|jgi:CBS domain-containing protein|nr:CBS domain-containing protein [Pyrobaculum sp.]
MDKVGAFVKRPPLTATQDATLLDVVKIMATHNIGLVALVDEAGRPLGVVSERDVIRALARGVQLSAKAIEVGTRGNLLTAKADEDIYSAIKKMRERGTRHILVVDDAGKLVGVVSIRDLIEDRALKSIGDKVWWPPPEE